MFIYKYITFHNLTFNEILRAFKVLFWSQYHYSVDSKQYLRIMSYTIQSEVNNDAETRNLVEHISKEEAERKKLKKDIKERQIEIMRTV